MNHLLPFIVLVAVVACSLNAFSQENVLFPEEQLHDLLLITADPDNSSFVVRNRAGEQRKGHVGDVLSSERGKVIKVTYRSLTVKTVEIVVDKNGTAYEQPTATTVLSGITNCLSGALPWLHGAWELKHDPDNSKIDWMFFNNKTSQFGLMFHDGRLTGAQDYHVSDLKDGSFKISVTIGNSRSRATGLTVSSDRSRIYNETSAYYEKVSDEYRDINDRGFREKRRRARSE